MTFCTGRFRGPPGGFQCKTTNSLSGVSFSAPPPLAPLSLVFGFELLDVCLKQVPCG
jgi:hypothetical protein